MKYKIVVEKAAEKLYFAHCPVAPRLEAFGVTADEALVKLQSELLCYLHDPKAELEIVFEGSKEHGSTDVIHGAV